MQNCCQKCLIMNKIILYVVLLFVVIFSHGCACRKVLVNTPKIQIIKPERCISASTKPPCKPFEYNIENGKLVLDNKNLITLNQNIAIIKTAYEELKLCYTNPIDYYVSVANL